MNLYFSGFKAKYEKQLADDEKKYNPAFDKIEMQLKMPGQN